jgi:UDP-N-acetylglucosamine:LPS N-acetylglucosamine transferase
MSEAVYLGKPMLAMPLVGQFEQLMNSRYLERDGYGVSATELTAEILDRFLTGLDGFEDRLAGYEQDGNDLTLNSVRDRIDAAAAGRPRDLRRARRLSRMRYVGRQANQGEEKGERQ